MSAKLSLSVTNPLSQPLEIINRFFIGTFRVGKFRVLAELASPNLRDVIDVKLEIVDKKESDYPGIYLNAIVMGFGIYLTFYDAE